MKLFPRKKNKLQDNSPAVRLQAVLEADAADLPVIADLAIGDEDAEVRQAAVKKLDDLALLDRVFDATTDDSVRFVAAAKRDRIRLQILQQESDVEEHREQLSNIGGQEILIEVAATAFFPDIRLAAVELIKDSASLEKLASMQCGKTVAEEVLSRIKDADVLERLTASGGNKTVKRLAGEKLSFLKGEKEEHHQEAIEEELRNLVENANRLADSVNWELARQRFEELEAIWASLCIRPDHPLKKDLVKARTTFEQRYERLLAHQLEERRQKEEKRKLHDELEAILSQIPEIPPLLCEKFPEKLEELTEKFHSLLRELDDEQAEYRQRLQKAIEALQDNIEIFRIEEEKLRKLAPLVQEIADSNDDVEAKRARFENLSKDFAAVNWRFVEIEPLRQEMKVLGKELDEKSVAQKQSREQEKEEARSKASEILDELAILYEHSDMHEAIKRFVLLEESWHALPQGLLDDTGLAAGYRRKRARFLVRKRDFLSLEEWRLWVNGTIKARLVEEVRDLNAIDDLADVFGSLKILQARWKEIGPTAGKTNATLWQQFREQCQRQFVRCKPYLEQQGELRQQQTKRMEKIAEEAEALATSEKWGETATRIGFLQKELEELSLIPFKFRKELLKRFRKAKNSFFEKKRLALQEQSENWGKNLNQKIALCERAEALSAQPESARPTDYKNLQKEWKRIGPAARKDEQAAWARFRAACDTYFNWLDQQRSENLRQKEELVVAARETADAAETAEDFRPLQQNILELQNNWKDIGPVPNQDRDRIWKEFRQHCDRFFAVKQNALESILQEQEENQRQKENIIDQIEQLAVNLNDKKTAERIKALQKDFFAIGPAGRNTDHQLRRKLKNLCNNYFEGRSRYFTDMHDKRQELLKEKERLLFELERLVGVSSAQKRWKQPRTLDLAEQLRLALESNFAMADRGSASAVREEIARLKKEWKGLESLPIKLEHGLQQRFEDAVDFFEREKR